MLACLWKRTLCLGLGDLRAEGPYFGMESGEAASLAVEWRWLYEWGMNGV